MPLRKSQKAQIVAELKDKFFRKRAAIFVSFTGVDVKTSQVLRKNLKTIQGEYKVVKKTLLARALDEVNVFLPPEAMQGQLAITFDYASQVEGAKILSEFTKRSNFVILGGLIGDAFLSGEKIKELALLPSMEVLHTKLIFTLRYPLTALVRVLKAPHINLTNILRAVNLLNKTTNH